MSRKPPSRGRESGAGRILWLLSLLALAALASWWWKSPGGRGAGLVGRDGRSGATVEASVVKEFTQIEAAEKEVDRTVWAVEQVAQARGALIEELWETLNASGDAMGLLRDLALARMSGVAAGPMEDLPHGIRRLRGSEGGTLEEWPDWRERVERWRGEGWHLDQSEWRHVRFLPGTNGVRSASWVDVNLDLSRPQPPERAEVTARVRVSWSEPAPEREPAGEAPKVGIREVSVESFDVRRRVGGEVFREAFSQEYEPFPKTSWIDPVLMRERPGGAGGVELILAGRNEVVHRRVGGTWASTTLSTNHPGLVFTAVLGDFSGDGLDDLLWAVRGGLVLSRGDAEGRFDTAAEPVWLAPTRLEYAQALTCGDIDGDGDLDVYLGQYRPPYVGGQMPRPYFDALDGPPGYLLRNEGGGKFADATVGSGLEIKRHRRTYGASWVDLDGDGDLDLAMTSDFAGMDLFLNDGKGRFQDVTSTQLDDPRGFGMSHAIADFDADGRLDLLMIAMPQPTADRLDALATERPGFESWRAERRRAVVGNRLFFGVDGGFRQRTDVRGLARCGWAWSAAVLDFDHDRLPDLHVVNGHETRASVKDYEREFWTHDIYVGDSTGRPAVDAYFAAKFAVTRSLGWSYGGHDRNRLLWNRGGKDFVSVGHLFGVATRVDSRNAVAEDLDGDGDEDLVVTTFEIWPRVRQVVRVLENTLERTGQWIGFRLPPGAASMGATITVRDRLGSQVRTWTSGEGYRSQGKRVVRFGLGEVTRVDEVEVRWVGGKRTTLRNLDAGRVHGIEVAR